jgi:hypothetical protein
MTKLFSAFCMLLILGAACPAADLTMVVDTALTEVPVNKVPLLDDTDAKSIEGAVAHDASGMALYWNFVATSGVSSVTAVSPTTSGVHDWSEGGSDTTAGMYFIEIPASGGSINNDTEGVGWFTGVATGVLPWTGPTIQFVPANIANSLVNGSDKLQTDAVEISSSPTAANNAELVFDADFSYNYDAANGNWQVDAVRLGGTSQTGRDIGASVLLSPGTGMGQLSISSGLLAWNPAWDVETQSEATDALNAYDPPTNTEFEARTPTATAATQINEAFDNDGTGGDFDISSVTVSGAISVSGQTTFSDAMQIGSVTANVPGLTISGSGSGAGLSLVGGDDGGSGLLAQPGTGGGTGLSGNISGNLSGSVGSVTGDVGGKVLGGGSGTISGTGVRAVDGSGNAIAPASTALSTAQWTSTRAGYLDNLSGGAVATQSSVNMIDAIVDNIFTAFEADGGVFRLTTNALEQLATDWSATEKNQIRHRLGLDGTTSTPSATPSLGTVNANITAMANNVMTASAADSTLGTELGNATWATTTRTLSGDVNDFDELLDGAPTFADAMDEHGYTTGRAEKIDRLAPSLLLSTTVEVAASQTSLELDEGPTEDDVFNGSLVIITDASEPAIKAVALIKDYDGDTKTITLVTDPEIFTITAEDSVDVIATGSPAALWLGSSP